MISGNSFNNIRLAHANGTFIAGNIIGLNAAGDTAITGGDFGIDLDSSSRSPSAAHWLEKRNGRLPATPTTASSSPAPRTTTR
ncbi:MAG: hypothetical protein U0791_13055 [Gemmataceae bacterium]